MSIKTIYFSASGTTERLAKALTDGITQAAGHAASNADAAAEPENGVSSVNVLRDRDTEPITVLKGTSRYSLCPCSRGVSRTCVRSRCEGFMARRPCRLRGGVWQS